MHSQQVKFAPTLNACRTTLKQNVVTPLIEFYNDSVNLLRKCDKPDRKGASRDCDCGGQSESSYQ